MLALDRIRDDLTNEANQSGDVFRLEEDTTLDLYPTDETSQGTGFLADQLLFKYGQKV